MIMTTVKTMDHMLPWFISTAYHFGQQEDTLTTQSVCGLRAVELHCSEMSGLLLFMNSIFIH